VFGSFFGHKNGRQKTDNGRDAELANEYLIDMRGVVKEYRTPAGVFRALKDVDLQVGRGEFVAVVGKSGSGKSTLINMFTGIDRPSGGEIMVNGTPLQKLGESQMAIWRGRNLGVIFQFFQLLPTLSVIENVMLPMDLANVIPADRREARALSLLEQVDMAADAHKLPSELSGGQQQKVAIARALANDPPLIAADEPTGNLDSKTAEAMFRLFERVVSQGKTFLMVTHDRELAKRVPRTIVLADGAIVDDIRNGVAVTPEAEPAENPARRASDDEAQPRSRLPERGAGTPRRSAPVPQPTGRTTPNLGRASAGWPAVL